MYNLDVTCFFEAAHQLPDSENLVTKKCTNLHGHSYCAKVKVIATDLQDGMVVDFKKVKDIVDKLDHKFINDVFRETEGWEHEPTTAENIALWVHNKLVEELGLENEVSICEGYKGHENSNWVTFK